jgi:hypothetical protein
MQRCWWHGYYELTVEMSPCVSYRFAVHVAICEATTIIKTEEIEQKKVQRRMKERAAVRRDELIVFSEGKPMAVWDSR